MPVEDVFSITGRGTVATGRVERGILKVQDEVEIVGLAEEPRKVVVTGVEMFRKLLDQAQAGDNIGALIRGVQRNEIERGQVMAKQEQLSLTLNSWQKYTFLRKKKVEDTLHSSMDTDHNSTSEQQTLQELVSYQKV